MARVNRLPRRSVLLALMAAFVWTLTLRPLTSLAPSALRGVAAPMPARVAAARHPQVLRLHILANSNSGPDQAAKLAVRAVILPLLTQRVGRARSAVAAEAAARAAAPAIAAAASRTLQGLGRPYGARVVVGDAYFPAKSEGGLRLAAGVYPAVTVVLGRGEGQNWWCVLFPDMCLANPLDTLSRSEPASGAEVLLGGASRSARHASGIAALVDAVLAWL